MVSNLPASLPLSESTIANGGELFAKVWTKVAKVRVQSFTNIIPLAIRRTVYSSTIKFYD